MEKKMHEWQKEIIEEKLNRKRSIYSAPVEPSDSNFNEDAFMDYLEHGTINEERLKMLMNF